jgi:hypothetical protein
LLIIGCKKFIKKLRHGQDSSMHSTCAKIKCA